MPFKKNDDEDVAFLLDKKKDSATTIILNNKNIYGRFYLFVAAGVLLLATVTLVIHRIRSTSNYHCTNAMHCPVSSRTQRTLERLSRQVPDKHACTLAVQSIPNIFALVPAGENVSRETKLDLMQALTTRDGRRHFFLTQDDAEVMYAYHLVDALCKQDGLNTHPRVDTTKFEERHLVQATRAAVLTANSARKAVQNQDLLDLRAIARAFGQTIEACQALVASDQIRPHVLALQTPLENPHNPQQHRTSTLQADHRLNVGEFLITHGHHTERHFYFALLAPEQRCQDKLYCHSNLVVLQKQEHDNDSDMLFRYNILWQGGTMAHEASYLFVQGDGNVVLYANGDNNDDNDTPIWSTATPNCDKCEGEQYHLVMQDDGNAVLYVGPGPGGAPIWATASDPLWIW